VSSTPTKVATEALDRLFDADNYLFFHDAFMPPARRTLEADFLKAALEFRPNLALLDLGCGHGRHTNQLAPFLGRVVGIDRNPTFLNIARQEAAAIPLTNVSYLGGDIREVAYPAEFDRILLVDTILGLFSDVEADELLVRIFAALRPGGLLCVDTINRDTILVDFKPHAVAEKDNDYLIDRLHFDPATGRMTNDRVYIRSGVSYPAAFSLRLHNLTELSALLTKAGFVVEKVFGAWNGDQFGAQAKKIIAIAKKPR